MHSTLVVNPGSVGQPRDGDPRASYVLWSEGSVALRRVAYDVAAVAKDLVDCAPPDVALLLAGVLHTGGTLPVGTPA
jgi:diadenosine tetraphosphatase ApaH/serine/threonine PP2A family protein phosphatase